MREIYIIFRGGVEDTRFEAKDTKKFQGQGPRTQTQVFSKKKKVLKIFFQAISKKKVFKNFFQAEKVFKNFFSGDLYLRKPKIRSLQIFRKVLGVFQRNFNGSKIVLSSSRGQGNFRGHEASRPRPRTLKCVLEDSTSDYFALCIGLVLMQPINYFAAYYYTGASVKGEQLWS